MCIPDGQHGSLMVVLQTYVELGTENSGFDTLDLFGV